MGPWATWSSASFSRWQPMAVGLELDDRKGWFLPTWVIQWFYDLIWFFFKELQKKVEKKSINHRFSISPGIEVSFFFFLSVLTQFNPKLVLEIRRMWNWVKMILPLFKKPSYPHNSEYSFDKWPLHTMSSQGTQLNRRGQNNLSSLLPLWQQCTFKLVDGRIKTEKWFDL